MYNNIVLDHFANPRNIGEITTPHGVGHTGNPADGDKTTIFLSVDQGIIVDVKFKTFGCAAAIAASSMLTVLAMGKSISEAMNITNEKVAEALGGLPPQKLMCSNIAADALHNAIESYLSNPTKGARPIGSDFESCGTLPDTKELLTNDQIKRYLRHIIMPQIGGVGQRDIIETRVVLYAQTVEACEIMLYYMVAVGIGQIDIYLVEKSACWDSVYRHLLDINPKLALSIASPLNENLDPMKKTDFNIILGDLHYIGNIHKTWENSKHCIPPTLIGTTAPWLGALKFCNNTNEIAEFINEISFGKCVKDPVGMILSNLFIGPMAVTELLKSKLSMGEKLRKTLYFNLLQSNYTQFQEVSNPSSSFNLKEVSRKLSQLKVLIVGTGGLGSPVALALAKAGVGNIGLIDHDSIEISNLNRQILHSTSRIGLFKVDSAKTMLKLMNPDVNIQTYPKALTKDNATELVKKYHIIVDGLDNIPSRYILNDACYKEGKPLVEAGVLTFYGQTTTIIPKITPCYRCMYPEKDTSNISGCSELGVLGTVPGQIGIIQAAEVIKLALGVGSRLNGGLLMYDSLETEFNIIPLLRSNNCDLCGKE